MQHCWKIVRTTELGGVRLLYNGEPQDGVCNVSTAPKDMGVAFKFSYNEVLYGYMRNNMAIESYGNYPFGYEFGHDVVFGHDVTYDEGTKTYTLTGDTITQTSMDISTNCEHPSFIFWRDTGTQVFWWFKFSDGTTARTFIEEQNANENDSEMKQVLDQWYENRMTSYTKYLEDSIYCNIQVFKT